VATTAANHARGTFVARDAKMATLQTIRPGALASRRGGRPRVEGQLFVFHE
jgi:hypothetical protein